MPEQLVATLLPEPGQAWQLEAKTKIQLAETDHRVANALTLLSGLVRLHATKISKRGRVTLSSREVTTLLAQIEGRIHSVARLHMQLAHGDHEAPIDLAAFLRHVAEETVPINKTSLGRGTAPAPAPTQGRGQP